MAAIGYTGGDPSKLDVSGYVKGDVVAANASGVLTPVPVGPDTDVLTADSVAPEGVDWQAGSGGGGGTPSNTVVTETTFGQSSTAGVVTAYSRGDHTHGTPAAPSIPAAATTVTDETTFGISPAVGVAVPYARQDHTHGTPAAPSIPAAATTVTDETTFGISPAVGVATPYARQDHTHGSPTAPTAASVGADPAGTGAAQAAAVAATIADAKAARFGLQLVTIETGAVTTDFSVNAGVAVFVLVFCTRSVTLTTLGAWVTAPGVTGSGDNNMAIYSEAGVRLGITGDMTGALAAGDWAEGTLTSGVPIVVGTRYYLHLLTHFSGTAPKIAAGATSFNHIAINTHLPTIFLTGQASSPASFTPGTANVNTAEYFLGAR
jgi:hypothetical protein